MLSFDVKKVEEHDDGRMVIHLSKEFVISEDKSTGDTVPENLIIGLLVIHDKETQDGINEIIQKEGKIERVYIQ